MTERSDEFGEDEILHMATESMVTCPHCGEEITISHDPAGGRVQEYHEDCQVCCRPWRVRVSFSGSSVPEVDVEAAD